MGAGMHALPVPVASPVAPVPGKRFLSPPHFPLLRLTEEGRQAAFRAVDAEPPAFVAGVSLPRKHAAKPVSPLSPSVPSAFRSEAGVDRVLDCTLPEASTLVFPPKSVGSGETPLLSSRDRGGVGQPSPLLRDAADSIPVSPPQDVAAAANRSDTGLVSGSDFSFDLASLQYSQTGFSLTSLPAGGNNTITPRPADVENVPFDRVVDLGAALRGENETSFSGRGMPPVEMDPGVPS